MDTFEGSVLCSRRSQDVMRDLSHKIKSWEHTCEASASECCCESGLTGFHLGASSDSIISSEQ